MPKLYIHEDLSREDQVTIGTERSFSFVFAIVFFILGYFVIGIDNFIGVGVFSVGIVFLIVGIICPRLLRPLNIVWFKFGIIISRVMNPIIMGILFYTSIVPIGLILRLLNKEPLRLNPQPAAKTYWIEREPPGPLPTSMKNQF